MKERIKTISLIFLMILGVYLTQKIWIQFPKIIPNFTREDEAVDEVNLLEGIIVPEKCLVNFGQGDFTLVYDDRDYELWKRAKESMDYIFRSEDTTITQISNKDYNAFKENRSIEFEFAGPMNSHILSSSLNIKDLNHIVEEIEEIEKIYLSIDEEEFFIFSNGDNHILIEDENLSLDTLRAQVDDVEMEGNYIRYKPLESLDSDAYIPVNMDISLAELGISNNIYNLDEEGKNQLAERFFSREIDYIREIVESNGSTIYEYDNNVLKLNSNGVIEYFHTLDDSYSEPNLYISLSTAVDFLVNRMEVPNDIFLSRVEDIQSDNGKGYRLYFRYKTDNIPILVGNGFSDYIQMDVFNDQIVTYRHLANEGEIINKQKRLMKKIISPEEIINYRMETFEEDFIESIDLSYFDSATEELSQKLLLVWIIETSDVSYVFNAYTGGLLYEK